VACVGVAVPDPLGTLLQFHLSAVPHRKSQEQDDGLTWLGYSFKDSKLLAQALTHGSAPGGKGRMTYERLEFLGDRVLSLVIAETLFKQHEKEPEGKLSARLSAVVRGEVCAEIAESLGVAERLAVGTVERRAGVQNVRSVLGDVIEAIIGAIYLDGGYSSARTFIVDKWAKVLAHPELERKDAKTFVQEWALSHGKALPTYEVLSRTGPEHRPVFTVKLSVAKHGEAEGVGSSKQAAEMDAAKAFIVARGLR
jgi:ribonuclease III